jgi:hypothetical protein
MGDHDVSVNSAAQLHNTMLLNASVTVATFTTPFSTVINRALQCYSGDALPLRSSGTQRRQVR